MKTKMYSVWDTKAECFGTPFFMPNRAMAQRAFDDLGRDTKTTISQHPEDYMLYELGDFDDIVGDVKSDKPINLGHIKQRDMDGDILFTPNGKKEAERVS